MVKIRLKRMGAKRRPYYRIVVMDSRTPRDGKAIEELGYYHPVEPKESQIKVDQDRVQVWIKNGAQPTATVKKLINKAKVAK
jgi:small subunit ribosomal protein S16